MVTIGLYTLLVAGLIIGVLRSPSVALVGVLCMFGLEQWAQASEPFFLNHQSYTNITIGVLVVFGLVMNIIKSRRICANYPTLGWLVMGLFCYALVSASWAPRIDISYSLWAKAWPYIVTVVVLSPLLITSVKDLEPVIKLIVTMGGILAVLLTFDVEWYHRRIVLANSFSGGVYGNPLTVSQMAGNVIIAALLVKRRNTQKIFELAKWAVSAVCLILIIKSGSRGQLIALFISLALVWPMAHRINNIKGLLFAISILFLVTTVSNWALQVFWGGTDRWSDDSISDAMGGRLNQALVLLSHWFDDPFTILFGLGNSASYDPRIIGIYPHFVPLEILAEEGLLGISIYLLIVFAGIKSALRSFSLVKHSEYDRKLLAVLCAMTIYAFLLSLKQGSLLLNLEFFMFSILLWKHEILLKNAAIQSHTNWYPKNRIRSSQLSNPTFHHQRI